MKIDFNVNGEPYRDIDITPATSLSDLLRDTLELTGTKRGCDTGGCGMCTVILEGLAVYSCMMPAWRVDGKSVETIEGLANDGGMHPLQEAFIRNFAPQCGYCTPGILMASKALIDGKAKPSESEIRDALSGVVCRCTGYIQYLKSIREVVSATLAKDE